MENCEAMTSSTHSFAYLYWLFKKRFVENYENSKFIIFLIFFYPIYIKISLFFYKNMYSFYWININLDWISPLSQDEWERATIQLSFKRGGKNQNPQWQVKRVRTTRGATIRVKYICFSVFRHFFLSGTQFGTFASTQTQAVNLFYFFIYCCAFKK